jgi:hypothetical protein
MKTFNETREGIPTLSQYAVLLRKNSLYKNAHPAYTATNPACFVTKDSCSIGNPVY